MIILAIKKSKQNIRSKKTKNSIWETLLILAGTVAAIVQGGVDKGQFEKKNCKIFGNIGEKFAVTRENRLRDWKKICSTQAKISRLEIRRVLFWSSAK